MGLKRFRGEKADKFPKINDAPQEKHFPHLELCITSPKPWNSPEWLAAHSDFNSRSITTLNYSPYILQIMLSKMMIQKEGSFTPSPPSKHALQWQTCLRQPDTFHLETAGTQPRLRVAPSFCGAEHTSSRWEKMLWMRSIQVRTTVQVGLMLGLSFYSTINVSFLIHLLVSSHLIKQGIHWGQLNHCFILKTLII